MTQATAVEEFLAAVMSEFPDQLCACLRAGRRAWSNWPTIDGVPIPSARMLAIFVVAGVERLSISEALKLTEKNGQLEPDLRRASERILDTVSRGVEFRDDWLVQLALGVGADDDQRSLLTQFVGRPGNGDELDREAIFGHLQIDSFRALRLARDYSSAIIQDTLECPRGYPTQMTVPHLAEMLRASHLPPEWTEQWEHVARLYSDATYYADRPTVRAIEIAESNLVTVLLGDPGHGKSTVLAAIAARTIAGGRIGLLIRFTDFAKALQGRIRLSQAVDVLDSAITAAGYRSGRYASAAEREAIVDECFQRPGESVLLFDGLDELPSAVELAQVRRALAILAPAGIRTVISSRLTGYTSPVVGAPEYLLNRLSPMEVDTFVSDWFSTPGLQHFETRARLVTDSQSIVAIPLVVGFVCLIAEHDDVATTMHGLYEQYLELFLQRNWKDDEHWVSDGDVFAKLNAATEVALAMAAPGIERAGKRLRLDVAPPQWMDNATPQFLSGQVGVPDGFEALLGPDGLLVPHSNAGPNRLRQSYRWIHRTVHEHLAGRAVAQRVQKAPDEWMPFLRQVLLRRTWQVAVEHAAGFLRNFGILGDVVDAIFSASTLMTFRPRASEDAMLEAALDLLVAAGSDYRRGELALAFVSDGETRLAMRSHPETTLGYWRTARLKEVPRAHVEYAAYHLAALPTMGPEKEVARRLSEFLADESRQIQLLHIINPRAAEIAAFQLIKTSPIESFEMLQVVERSDETIDDIVALIAQDLSVVTVTFVISVLAYDAWEIARPRLAAAIEHHGAVGAFVLDMLDREHEHSDRMHDIGEEFAVALLTESAPPWAAYFFAAAAQLPANTDSTLVTPWARAGLAFRSFKEDRLPDDGWSAERSDAAIDALFAGNYEDPDADVVAEMWLGVQWALRNRTSNRVSQILQIYHANNVSNWHWWAFGVFNLQNRAQCFGWDVLVEAVRANGRQDPLEPDLGLLGEAAIAQPGLAERRMEELFAFAIAEFPSLSRFDVAPKFAGAAQLRTIARRFLDDRPVDKSSISMALAQLWKVAAWLHDYEILDEFWDEIVAINIAPLGPDAG